ncbi:MAG: glycosyltransferase family 2 protein [Candidatus Goldbacteria bacterium]|nr:glycosyltransferase family 2 protein [Candidatus Goldiibacteriota bacterium]
MKISIVVPLLNQIKYTKKCFASIKANTDDIAYEIIAVDNGSSDGTVEYLKKQKIKFIENGKNMGVAKAWNQGVRAASGRMVCIINNDIVAGKGWLSSLADFYLRKNNAGIVSPGTREGALDYEFQAYAESYTARMKNVSRKWFSGWCMLIASDRFEKVGLFSEEFGIGIGEDMDFFLRLKKCGFESYITGSSFIHHFGSRTIKDIKENEGDGFEKENIQKLEEKWGNKSCLIRRFEKLTGSIDKRIMKAVYGHNLVEKI